MTKKKSIAEKVVETIPYLSAFTRLTEYHLKIEDKEKNKIFIFEDLSVLKINKNEDAFLSKPKNIEDIEFNKIKIKKSIFNMNNKIKDSIIKMESVEDGKELFFVKIAVSEEEKIKTGFESIYLTNEGFCFIYSISGKKIIEIKEQKKKITFLNLNIDYKLLLFYLKEKKEREDRLEHYGDNLEDIIDFLS